MARVPEHIGKGLLAEAGLLTPRGEVAVDAAGARRIAEYLGKPVVVKAQVLAGRRGRAGGVRFAQTPAETWQVASEILAAEVRGQEVSSLLIEERLDIVAEFYLGVVVDSARGIRAPVVMVSATGGMEIEEVPADLVARSVVDVRLGLGGYQAINLARRAGIPSGVLQDVAAVTSSLYEVFRTHECRSLEINPLALTRDQQVVAADCRMAIDDAAAFRHPTLGIEIARDLNRQPTAFDRMAWAIEEGDLRGTGYVAQISQDMDAAATVGFHGIGGGGAILGVDALNRAGLRVANYADTSGNPPASKVYRVAKLILSQPGISGYCLGGFMAASQEQWHQAHGVVRALREEIPGRPGFPAVILICGNGEEESMEILRDGTAGLPGRIELYGSDHVYDTEFIAGRMRALVEEYLGAGGNAQDGPDAF